MDEIMRRVAATQDGVILRGQALDLGLSDDEISRRRGAGVWRAIRRGAYVEAVVWDALDDVGRHRCLVRAVLLQLDEPAVASHQSAAVILSLPVWDVDLSTVHVTRRERHSPRCEAGVAHHVGELPESDVIAVDGLAVTAPARTAVDLARTVPFEQAVVTADGALALPHVTRDDLMGVHDRMRSWRGARAAGRAIAFADGRSESVGESRHRVQIRRIGLPAPELQVVLDPDGAGDRLDFYFEQHATAGEFDGRRKYERDLRPGEDPADALWREKRREDRLRERGLEIVRPVWADLYRDDAIAARYHRAFTRSRKFRLAV
jgi:hypothetical protein